MMVFEVINHEPTIVPPPHPPAHQTPSKTAEAEQEDGLSNREF